ncbi:hypothetical protein [Aquipuribacter hungaricus]|uniref:Hpt domain-containing protein n=1 Tax=Aquipuribacter hungaricus TaxID=545624 RepID=A0ABV7WIZ7_9MICO
MKALSAAPELSPADSGAGPHRCVPPIGSGELDSLALLRFEVLDALAVAEAVLHQIHVLEDWVRALSGRYEVAPSLARALDAEVIAVGQAALPTRPIELLLLALDELHGHLDTGSVAPAPQGVRRS